MKDFSSILEENFSGNSSAKSGGTATKVSLSLDGTLLKVSCVQQSKSLLNLNSSCYDGKD